MDAQYAAVVEFVRQHGGTIVAQYVEVESSDRSDRPELAKALESARKGKATTRSVIADIFRSGMSSLVEIGKALEVRGVPTPRGHTTWRPVQVWRLLAE